MGDLAQILADARGEAQVMRRTGQKDFAGYVEDLCDKVAEATEDFRTFLSEKEAMLQSARASAWFRARFPEWESEGNARRNQRGEREYRQIIVPRRANVSAAREAGQRAAEKAS